MLLTLTPSETLFGIGTDDYAKTAEKLIVLLETAIKVSISPRREQNCIKLESVMGEMQLYPEDKAGYYLLTGLDRIIDQHWDDVDAELLEFQLPGMSIIDDCFCDLDWYEDEVLTEID